MGEETETNVADVHRLQNEWVLWEHKAAESKNPNQWKDNMLALCSFNTAEEFWRYTNHIPRPSEVFFDGECRKKVDGKTVEEYSLFKRGIEPEWGDSRNVRGGEWFCRQFFDGESLDLYWQNLVLAVIGETMEPGGGGGETAAEAETNSSGDRDDASADVINGVRVVDKSRGYPMFKLEIWLATRDPAVREAIKERLQEIITDGQPAGRKAHPKFEWKDHT